MRRPHRMVASIVVLIARHAPQGYRGPFWRSSFTLHLALSDGLLLHQGHLLIFAKRCFFEGGVCPGHRRLLKGLSSAILRRTAFGPLVSHGDLECGTDALV